MDVQSITADSNSLTLTTNAGVLLVTGDKNFNVSSQANLNTGFQDVYAQGSDITASIQSGNLAGYLQLRDQEVPSLASQLDTLASGIATSVNTQSAAGYDLNGLAGGNFFVPPAAVAGAALNMAVAITDPSKVAASADGTPGNNANATAMANLQSQPNIAGQTPINYYSSIVFPGGQRHGQCNIVSGGSKSDHSTVAGPAKCGVGCLAQSRGSEYRALSECL